MSDFVRQLQIEHIIAKAGFDPSGNFEAIYSEIHRRKLADVLNELDNAVRSYFSKLLLPETPTLYDYLILALRPKDLVVTFNWDPMLAQVYRCWRHLGHVLPQIAFLHGNVDVAVNMVTKKIRFVADCGPSHADFTPTRLLYPVTDKNYNDDPFIKDQWDLALNYLKNSYYVTVYGYSAPKTDVEARKLLLNAWNENLTQTLAEFDVVDIAPKADVEKSWSEFIIDTHGGILPSFDGNYLTRHPRRTCEAFAFATLQLDPWHENPFPDAQSLDELENWVRPFLAEEKSGKLSDVKRKN
jgi:hypothetical protein